MRLFLVVQGFKQGQTVSFLTHQIVAVADCHCCIACQFFLERFDSLAASISQAHE